MSFLPAAGRHPVSVGHLVMGVAFLGLALVWALLTADVIDVPDLRWLSPLPWVAAGAAGLAAVAVSARRRRRADADAGADIDPDYPPFDPYPPQSYPNPTHEEYR